MQSECKISSAFFLFLRQLSIERQIIFVKIDLPQAPAGADSQIWSVLFMSCFVVFICTYNNTLFSHHL